MNLCSNELGHVTMHGQTPLKSFLSETKIGGLLFLHVALKSIIIASCSDRV